MGTFSHPTGVELPFKNFITKQKKAKNVPNPPAPTTSSSMPLGERSSSPISRLSVSSPEIDTIDPELDQNVDTTDYHGKRVVRASSFPPRLGSDATPRRLKQMSYR